MIDNPTRSGRCCRTSRSTVERTWDWTRTRSATATWWWGSTLPASEVRAPFGMRMATAGMCSNESGMENSSTFIGSCPDRSRQQRQGLLDQIGERADELSAPRTVQRPVIAGEREHHRRLDGRLTVEGDHAVGDPPDGEDGGLRRVDDGVEGVDAVHAQVADREAVALDVGGAELAGL